MYQLVGDVFGWVFAILCYPAFVALALGGLRWVATFLVVAFLFSATLVAEGVVLSTRFLPFFANKRWGGLSKLRTYDASLSVLRLIGSGKESDRLAAFSGGVITIISTMMVLEFKAPQDDHRSAFEALAPIVFCYALSFSYVVLYWSDHHRLLRSVRRVNGTILWANTHLLFWLSLIPFTTAWMCETEFFSTAPVAAYGVGLLAAKVAYFLLTQAIDAAQGGNSTMRIAVGADVKGIVMILLYMAGIALAFIAPSVALVVYALIATMWFVFD
jgi:uncharacterized membrane protein